MWTVKRNKIDIGLQGSVKLLKNYEVQGFYVEDIPISILWNCFKTLKFRGEINLENKLKPSLFPQKSVL